MVGAGVFTTSGFALNDLGEPMYVLLAWAVGGVLALLGALSYAGLARRLPGSGGEYHYLTHTIHPLAGFLAGWVSLLAGFTAPIAVAALALQEYVAPVLGVSFRAEWIGTAAIFAAFLMHGLHRSPGVWLQNLAVGLKLLLLVGFIGFGAVRLPQLSVERPEVAFDIGKFAVTLVWISFAYAGWNAAVYVAGEVRDPERNATRSLWVGCTAVAVVYLALNTVFVYAAPVERIVAEANIASIGATAARALGGDWLWRSTAAIVALALFTSISAMMMAGPRVYARMAEDGLFPRGVVARGTTPVGAVALQSGLAILVVWWSDLAQLLGYVGLTLSLSTAATVIGLMRLRRREGAERVPVFGYPWVPLGFVAVTLAAAGFMVWLRSADAIWGLVTVVAGIPLYYVFRARRVA